MERRTVWISGPVSLGYPSDTSSTHLVNLSGIYEVMGRAFRYVAPVTMPIRDDRSSAGAFITSHSRGGIRRYSIRSHAHLRDSSHSILRATHWPIAHMVGTEPTPAQEIDSSDGHYFRLIKTDNDGPYTIDAQDNCDRSRVRLYVSNALSMAAYQDAYESVEVPAHVRTKSEAREMGLFRKGSPQSPEEELLPLLPHIPGLLPFLRPPYNRELHHSQSPDTFPMLARAQSALTRDPHQPQSIYMRDFISTDTAPTHVCYPVSGKEAPFNIDSIRERFPLGPVRISFSPQYRAISLIPIMAPFVLVMAILCIIPLGVYGAIPLAKNPLPYPHSHSHTETNGSSAFRKTTSVAFNPPFG